MLAVWNLHRNTVLELFFECRSSVTEMCLENDVYKDIPLECNVISCFADVPFASIAIHWGGSQEFCPLHDVC